MAPTFGAVNKNTFDSRSSGLTLYIGQSRLFLTNTFPRTERWKPLRLPLSFPHLRDVSSLFLFYSSLEKPSHQMGEEATSENTLYPPRKLFKDSDIHSSPQNSRLRILGSGHSIFWVLDNDLGCGDISHLTPHFAVQPGEGWNPTAQRRDRASYLPSTAR